MKRRLLYSAAIVLLAAGITLLVWQGSFTFGAHGPKDPQQTILYWAISTLVFILTVTLGFILSRTAVKLYVERRAGKVGSRIKSKLVVGALALSLLPTVFAVLWGVYVLNRNVDKWFAIPVEGMRTNLNRIDEEINAILRDKAQLQAALLAGSGELAGVIKKGAAPASLKRVCQEQKLAAAALILRDQERVLLCGTPEALTPGGEGALVGKAAVLVEGALAGEVQVATSMPYELAARQAAIRNDVRDYDKLARLRKQIRNFYLLLMAVITLFILFVATWIALFLAKQISQPIAALLDTAGRVRAGDLAARARVRAIDELATLVQGFNDMVAALESNSKELEQRRRFTEAILESIPSGVLSLARDGRILRVNNALSRIFPEAVVRSARRLTDLFSPEDVKELRYMMNRASRLGQAARQFDLKIEGETRHVSIVVAALESTATSGVVMVVEDTSELLRAQRAAAWHEVARRIAHEIRNPLTPIGLSAERLARQAERASLPVCYLNLVKECTATIIREVESVKTLVTEFSQFARFPAARLQLCDLNAVVRDALAVFDGRLQDIEIVKQLAPELPAITGDPDHLKRVVVNLVDNAAEAMQHSPVKQILIATQALSPDSVELTVADTGAGIAPEDKEKMFLPYFSTKNRGTGLGLAIVSHIVSEHRGQIRVEDNRPAGARFILEFPVAAPADTSARPLEVPA